MPEAAEIPGVRFGDCTFLEIRQRAQAGWLAVVPTGCTEQQGPHLPVDFDTWFAEAVTLAAAARAAQDYGVRALVLPAIPFGPTPEHRNYGSGYIHIPMEVHQALVHSVLTWLAEQRFRRIVVWRGCGGHNLTQVVEQFNIEQAGKARALLPALPYHDIWCRIGDPSVPGGHADSFATSIALHLRPDAVCADLIDYLLYYVELGFIHPVDSPILLIRLSCFLFLFLLLLFCLLAYFGRLFRLLP